MFLRVDGALRPAGGAARVQDGGGIVLVDRHVRQRGAEIVVPDLLELGLDLDHRHAQRLARDPREPLAVADQELRLGVTERIQDLVARPPAVHADRDRAERERRPERDDPFGAVRGEDRDAIALADSEALDEGLRDGRHHLPVLREREPQLVADEILVVTEAERALEQRPQVRRTLLEDRHHLAEHRLVHDLERPAGAGELGGDFLEAGHGRGHLWPRPPGRRRSARSHCLTRMQRVLLTAVSCDPAHDFRRIAAAARA